MAQLEVKNVAMSYGGKKIIEDVSFCLNEGDYLCIVGENGTGKSTLIKGLLGLKPIDSGAISFGTGITGRDIGYLPQQTGIQKNFPASVWEIVLSGFLNQKGFFYSKEQKAKAEGILEKLGISNIKNTGYRELSGGQQQRVLLARALCAASKVLLLDEPMASLDPVATTEMYELINRLNKKDKLTIIMVSHDISTACGYASHILHIKGKPLFFGTRDDYFASGSGFSGGGVHHD